MLPTEVMRQIRRLQLRARRAVQTLLGGEYHSVFKGTGLSFEEVREYQPGDDVRTIDWNVTARVGSPFIKQLCRRTRIDGPAPGRCQRQPALRQSARDQAHGGRGAGRPDRLQCHSQ